MEITKEKKKVPKYIEVESDEYEIITIYKTSDGKIFKDINPYTKDARQLAEQHEDKLTFDKIETMMFELEEFGVAWYKANSQEELDAVKRHLLTWGNLLEKGKIEPGKWFTYYCDYGANFISRSVSLKSLDTVITNLGKFLELFGKKIVDK